MVVATLPNVFTTGYVDVLVSGAEGSVTSTDGFYYIAARSRNTTTTPVYKQVAMQKKEKGAPKSDRTLTDTVEI